MRRTLTILTLLALGSGQAYALEPADGTADKDALKARAEAALAELDEAESELADAKAELQSLEKEDEVQIVQAEPKPEFDIEQHSDDSALVTQLADAEARADAAEARLAQIEAEEMATETSRLQEEHSLRLAEERALARARLDAAERRHVKAMRAERLAAAAFATVVYVAYDTWDYDRRTRRARIRAAAERRAYARAERRRQARLRAAAQRRAHARAEARRRAQVRYVDHRSTYRPATYVPSRRVASRRHRAKPASYVPRNRQYVPRTNRRTTRRGKWSGKRTYRPRTH